ncbi:abscisic acid 8'-hydroxylase 1 [Jatropha curcas]|uniref:abscisic acid 8'-hydroxylase 1 n=1 Tax=Jatropha curcas TaxID=180498 RepID=UPI0009D65850|nr:abscisic acid 8'-hydroxylase 1 [Jatropha curcas]
MLALFLPHACPCLCFYAVLVLSALVLFLMGKILFFSYNQESISDIPPGSRGFPFIGETLQFMAAIKSGKGFYEFVRIRRQRYGNCFKTSIFGQTHVFVSSTGSAKTILNNESGKFTKRYIKSIAELVGDQSLLCASHLHHKLLRSRLINLFSTSFLSVFIKQFDELIVKSLDTWENEATVTVLDQALKITFKAMCKMLMRMEDEEEIEELQKDITYVCEAMLAFPLRFPWTRFYKGLKARKRIMSTLEIMMTQRRRKCSSHANQDDFLQHLLVCGDKSSSDEVSKLTDSEIKDNILTMIIAGQDTTASAITWMVKYLGENENVLHKLCAEQFHIAEKISKRSFVTLEDFNDMPFASKVVKESLRMASIVPWLPRLALEDCEIEGFKIKKGWNINIDARSIHLDDILFEEPDKFNPSRFDDESKPYSFLGFGIGGRACLGINMAKAMMLVFLHRLVTTYKWKVIDSDSSTEKWALFSRLKSGCPVQVTRITRKREE